MFRLFGKRRESPREGVRKTFDQMMSLMQEADSATQVAIGYSINIVNSAFVKRFGSIGAFQALPEGDRLEYLASLTKAGELAAAKDPPAAAGFSLFKMWIAAISDNDRELIDHFARGISQLSRKGDLGA